MQKNKQKQIKVYAHWSGLSMPAFVGMLHVNPGRSKEIFSFEYSHEWLESGHSYVLDPSLQLFHGQQYAPVSQENFGVFLDSSPDRWGRFLMKRREAQLAREEKRVEHNLMKSDYLIG